MANESRKLKTYDELTFADDFMFCKILQNNPDLCKELTELILDREIGSIVEIAKQHPIEITADGHGVRFDIYMKDDQNTRYDIEMQTTQFPELPKRTRYYQSMIDLEALERSKDYQELPNSYVIFISLNNPFTNYGLHKYTFTNRCEENTELRLEDGAERIFISAKGDKNDISENMRSFLAYLTDQSTDSDLTRKLEDAVRKAKAQREWSREYMTLYEMRKQDRDEGRKEGIAEGIAKGKKEGKAEGIAEGRKEGKAEGIAEGKKEGKAEGKLDELLSLVCDNVLSEDVAADRAHKRYGIDPERFREMVAQYRPEDE